MRDYTPSTVPGSRTPHLWLADGRSLYDAMGRWFTLLRFDRQVDVTGLVGVAQQRGVPFAVLDVIPRDSAAPYRHALLISRPDFHVAWRGDCLPADPGELVDLVCGAHVIMGLSGKYQA
jgi:hypothetical protein